MGGVGLFTLAALTLPSGFSLERSTIVAAPSASVYRLLSTREGWTRWLGWLQEHDRTFRIVDERGPDRGTGLVVGWTAKHVGSGAARIIDCEPHKSVTFELLRAGVGFTMRGRFVLAPQDGSTLATKVSLVLSGDFGWNPFRRWRARFARDTVVDTHREALASVKRALELELVPSRRPSSGQEPVDGAPSEPVDP